MVNQLLNNKKIKKQNTTSFLGEYSYAIDEKGRLALPPKFRSLFSKGGIVTRGVDVCLTIFTPDAWQDIASHVATLPMNQGNGRAYARMILGGAMDIELDAQGRFVIPEYLREYAALDKEATIVGLHDKLEIWNAATWRNYRIALEKDAAHIAESLSL